MARTFAEKQATVGNFPVWLALFGPPDSGKTYTALELAEGMRSVTGGTIGLVDTEAERSRMYADVFDFKVTPFEPPFGSKDYLQVIQYVYAQGHRTIVIDQMSDEHEGIGGMLDSFEDEKDRIAARWNLRPEARDKATAAAWNSVKRPRLELIQVMRQMRANFVFVFRAKEKTDWENKDEKGRTKPRPLGWTPIAPMDFIHAMTVSVMLAPKAHGVPTWRSDEEAERNAIKMPAKFESLFPQDRPLTRATGSALATWGRSGSMASPPSPPKQAPAAKPAPAHGPKFSPASADVIADIRRCLTGDLEMERAAAAAWVVKYAGAPLTELPAEKAQAILRLARAAYQSRMANDDDAQFAATYDALKAEGVLP